MRIEFKFMPGPFRSYYEFDGVKVRIRCSGMFYWNFNGQTYRTDSANYQIYRDDIDRGKVEIASLDTSYSWGYNPPSMWNVVDVAGRNWQLVETHRHCGRWVEW